MPFYMKWKLGTPLLVSSIAGAFAVLVNIVALPIIALAHSEKGLQAEHLVVLVLFGAVVVMTMVAGASQELPLGLVLAGKNGLNHVLDHKPSERASEIEVALARNARYIVLHVRVMKWMRGISHLLLLVAFITAWWSAGRMFQRVVNDMKSWEIILLGACWLLYLPHALMPMIFHRQLALCRLCEWPALPKWMTSG